MQTSRLQVHVLLCFGRIVAMHIGSTWAVGQVSDCNRWQLRASKMKRVLFCCYVHAEITEDTTSTFDLRCLRTESGESYIGRVNYTLSGIPCQKWSDDSPHEHGYFDVTWFADFKIDKRTITKNIVNYCRNPSVLSRSSAVHPWCFTTNKHIKYEYCDIPRCKRKWTNCVCYATTQ